MKNRFDNIYTMDTSTTTICASNDHLIPLLFLLQPQQQKLSIFKTVLNTKKVYLTIIIRSTCFLARFNPFSIDIDFTCSTLSFHTFCRNFYTGFLRNIKKWISDLGRNNLIGWHKLNVYSARRLLNHVLKNKQSGVAITSW